MNSNVNSLVFEKVYNNFFNFEKFLGSDLKH